MKFDWVLLKVIHLTTIKSYSFRRLFRRQFSTVFDVVLQATSAVITAFPCKFGEVWLIIAEVINELGVKFDWLLLKAIHLDVNSNVNSQPFPMYFCRHHRLVLRQLPCKFGEVWLIIAEIINELGVKFDWLLLKVIHWDVNSDVYSQPFPM